MLFCSIILHSLLNIKHDLPASCTSWQHSMHPAATQNSQIYWHVPFQSIQVFDSRSPVTWIATTYMAHENIIY
jgi:hypothetical protein